MEKKLRLKSLVLIALLGFTASAFAGATFQNKAPYSVDISYWVLNWGAGDIDMTLPASGGYWKYDAKSWRKKGWVLVKSSVIDEGRVILFKEGESINKGHSPLFSSWVGKNQKLVVDKNGKVTVTNK